MIDNLKQKIPPGARRVKVREADGVSLWKEPSEIKEDDVILTRGDGIPLAMFNMPGRRAEDDNDSANINIDAKNDQIAKDALVIAARRDPDGLAVWDEVVRELAEEAASLKLERQDRDSKKKDSSQISMRRINALKSLAEMVLKRKDQLLGREIDLESPVFGALFSWIIETFQTEMKLTMRPEQIQLVFLAVSEKIRDDAWRVEAKKRMSKAI